MTYRKKLIEVALPLEAINMESAREKSIRHGHPSTLHLWWARRPLAACRAVLWASLVDDPSRWPEKFPTEEAQKQERQRLFDILGHITLEVDERKGTQKQVVRGLVSWDDINDPTSGVLEAGQREIARCLAWARGEEPPTKPNAVREYIAKYAPPAYDPFAGGGSIPLEAQRLGLEAHASDLNPVAVLINKALIEIPPKFRNQSPINPNDRQLKGMVSWYGAQGLAADVRYYGAWMRDRALERIGHLYPKVNVDGKEATVIAWLWARTVKCPNPACGCQMPLVRSFQLSTKKGKEAWVEPVIDRTEAPPRVQFTVKTGKGKAPGGTVERKGARCLACETPVPLEHVREEGRAGRMGQQLMAIVAEGKSGRIYLPPTAEQETIANSAQPVWEPDTDLPKEALGFRVQNYGMTKHADLFTARQLVALTTFSDLVSEAREQAIADAIEAGLPDDDIPLDDGGTGARAYGEAVAVYVAFIVDRLADFNSTICTWIPGVQATGHTFTRQALPMTWDFPEINLFGDRLANYDACLEKIIKPFDVSIRSLLASGSNTPPVILQHDATIVHSNDNIPKLISTDPPYYDAVPYADLSDFFYVWLRHSIGSLYPSIFNTVLVPKAQEMVADNFRHGSKAKAKDFFEESLIKVFHRTNKLNHTEYPVTVYYALKQTETDDQEQVGHLEKYKFSWEWLRDFSGFRLFRFAIWQLIEVPSSFYRLGNYS